MILLFQEINSFLPDAFDVFRFWFHACQFAALAFGIALLGFLVPSLFPLTQYIAYLLIPLGIFGGVLGLVGATRGIRSACPLCGQRGDWVVISRCAMAVDCESCGLVGGNPLKRLRPRVLLKDGNDPKHKTR
jgi:hypothetical protein